jgi:hypothetical protein
MVLKLFSNYKLDEDMHRARKNKELIYNFWRENYLREMLTWMRSEIRIFYKHHTCSLIFKGKLSVCRRYSASGDKEGNTLS